MAEREGFEPSRPLRAYGISSAAPSTELGDRSATILPITAQSPSSGDRRDRRRLASLRLWAAAFDRATAPSTILPITAETHVLRRTHLSRARQRRVLRKTYRIVAP